MRVVTELTDESLQNTAWQEEVQEADWEEDSCQEDPERRSGGR